MARAGAHLQLALLGIEEGHEEGGPVTKAAEDRALADASLGGDRLHREVLGADAFDHAAGRAQHALTVAECVGAQRRLLAPATGSCGSADGVTISGRSWIGEDTFLGAYRAVRWGSTAKAPESDQGPIQARWHWG